LTYNSAVVQTRISSCLAKGKHAYPQYFIRIGQWTYISVLQNSM